MLINLFFGFEVNEKVNSKKALMFSKTQQLVMRERLSPKAVFEESECREI